jgi:hypothetical protein
MRWSASCKNVVDIFNSPGGKSFDEKNSKLLASVIESMAEKLDELQDKLDQTKDVSKWYMLAWGLVIGWGLNSWLD